MFEPSNLFLNNYMTYNMILYADSSGVPLNQISDTHAKQKIHRHPYSKLLVHGDILGASLGLKICKHVCTWCTLKKIEAKNKFLASR